MGNFGGSTPGRCFSVFFFRAIARSMLRGCTDMPSCLCTSCARVRAWIGPPPWWCSSMTVITSGVSLWADFGPRDWGSNPLIPPRAYEASAR